MGILSSLTKEHREAIGILQIGTILEYFDLMLYVHMAVLLDQLFFPKTDPHTAALISAMTFCSTFVFRPLGALIFGYIGDHVGRNATVIITTTMMAISCVTMANLPTYAQIGITATWVITLCRIIQGLSSMGEIIGAQLYLTELIKPPTRYPAVSLIGCANCFGTMLALGVATAVFYLGLEWRIAFWIGASIALVGSIARTALRETPDFVDAKRQIKKTFEKANINPNVLEKDLIFNEKVNQKTTLAYFLMLCARPAYIYFCYIYCGNILKNLFSYTAEQVIQHNFVVALLDFFGALFYTYLSYKVHPLKIVKIRMMLFPIFVLLLPFMLNRISSPIHIMGIQLFICLAGINMFPAEAVFFIHFPIFKRFTYTSFIYALSRAIMYIITSFGLVYLVKFMGNYGLLVIFIPMVTGFWFGVLHFEKLEKEDGNYPQESRTNLTITKASANSFAK